MSRSFILNTVNVDRFQRQRRNDGLLWESSGPAFGLRAWFRDLLDWVRG